MKRMLRQRPAPSRCTRVTTHRCASSAGARPRKASVGEGNGSGARLCRGRGGNDEDLVPERERLSPTSRCGTRTARTLEEQCRTDRCAGLRGYVTGIPVMVRDVENWKALQYYQNVADRSTTCTGRKNEGYDAVRHRLHARRRPRRGQEHARHPGRRHQRDRLPPGDDAGRMFAVVTQLPGAVGGLRRAGRPLRGAEPLRSGALHRPRVGGGDRHRARPIPGRCSSGSSEAARRAVADGASVIVPSPAFLATLAHRAGLTHVDDALVLDTISVAVKQAETLADLRRIGIGPSRRIGVYCRPGPAMATGIDGAAARASSAWTERRGVAASGEEGRMGYGWASTSAAPSPTSPSTTRPRGGSRSARCSSTPRRSVDRRARRRGRAHPPSSASAAPTSPTRSTRRRSRPTR